MRGKMAAVWAEQEARLAPGAGAQRPPSSSPPAGRQATSMKARQHGRRIGSAVRPIHRHAKIAVFSRLYLPHTRTKVVMLLQCPPSGTLLPPTRH